MADDFDGCWTIYSTVSKRMPPIHQPTTQETTPHFMKLLLDTQLAFWWQTGDRKIPADAQALVEQHRTRPHQSGFTMGISHQGEYGKAED